ncbi:hypothetical protein [Nostoc sp.]
MKSAKYFLIYSALSLSKYVATNISASYPDIPPFAIISYKERKLDAEFSSFG